MWVTVLITVVHVIVCLFLIAVVLLQSGKSGDLAAAFGGQGSQTAFGPRGAATALTKATTWSAIIFMVTSITLSIFAARRTGPASVLSGVKGRRPHRSPPSRRRSASPGADRRIGSRKLQALSAARLFRQTALSASAESPRTDSLELRAHFRYGFPSLSSPIVVFGPWPGITIVSSGSASTR